MFFLQAFEPSSVERPNAMITHSPVARMEKIPKPSIRFAFNLNSYKADNLWLKFRLSEQLNQIIVACYIESIESTGLYRKTTWLQGSYLTEVNGIVFRWKQLLSVSECPKKLFSKVAFNTINKVSFFWPLG